MHVCKNIVPKDTGNAAQEMMIKLTSTAFLRFQPKLSMEQAIRFSKTAVTVEKLAKVMKTKNKAPHNCPRGIFTKMFGRVIK